MSSHTEVFYVVSCSKKSADFKIFDSNGGAIPFQKSRVNSPAKILKYLSYTLGLEWNKAGLISALKFIYNNKHLVWLIFTQSYSVKVDLCSTQWFHFSSSADHDKNFFISRYAILKGCINSTISNTLEHGFMKDPSNFIGGITSEPSRIMDFDRFDSLTAARGLLKSESESIHLVQTFSNAQILHGQVVLAENSFYQVHNSDSPVLAGLFKQPEDVLDPVKFISPIEKLNNLEKGIFLKVSPNWWHFLIETCPRILTIQKELREEYGLILDQSLPQPILQALRKFGFEKFIVVGLTQSIQVETLLLVSENSIYRPMEYMNRIDLIHQVASELSAGLDAENSGPELLFVPRNERLDRPLRNRARIRRSLVKRSFVELIPETQSLDSQISYFKSAKMIIIENGAACTNLIFCQPNTWVVELSSSAEAGFWSDFSRIFNLRPMMVLGKKCAYSRSNLSSDGYRIKLKTLISLIDELLKAQN